mmetsp:Transcript_72593/g.210167  ORF Transcript_72593/g.210167 Transcript_72593/m.210167 type:complete len:240 (+) Transcript_72593:292-1011(+)
MGVPLAFAGTEFLRRRRAGVPLWSRDGHRRRQGMLHPGVALHQVRCHPRWFRLLAGHRGLGGSPQGRGEGHHAERRRDPGSDYGCTPHSLIPPPHPPSLGRHRQERRAIRGASIWPNGVGIVRRRWFAAEKSCRDLPRLHPAGIPMVSCRRQYVEGYVPAYSVRDFGRHSSGFTRGPTTHLLELHRHFVWRFLARGDRPRGPEPSPPVPGDCADGQHPDELPATVGAKRVGSAARSAGS